MRMSALHVNMLRTATWAALLAGCNTAPTEVLDTAATDNSSVVQDELIVVTTPGADRDDLEDLYAAVGATVRDRLAALSADLLKVDPQRRDEVAGTLDDSPLVDGVAENHFVDLDDPPNDPLYAIQWHLTAIQAPAAWQTTKGSEQVVVAVLDTGVDTAHVDLASKLKSGGNTVNGAGGWQDTDGHGTEVAGIVGASSDNQAGIVSIARDCPIMPIRVTDDATRATSWSLAAGIALAVNEGARVINVSLAPLHDDEIVLRQAALARLAGALVVIAAGNSGEQISGGGSDQVLFVGAVNRDADLASFSAFGDFVDLVAPGVSIYTTRLNDEYGRASGTSYAAPLVSGVAALVWSVNPELQPATVQGILLSTATDLGPPGDDLRFGVGRVNARAAVELAGVIVEQRDETPPVLAIRRPVDEAEISGPTIIDIRVTDDSDLADVTLTLDGAAVASDAISPYAFVVDTAKYAVGRHEVSVAATDIFGNSSEQRITLVFAGSDDGAQPTISFVGPAAGSVVDGVVTILADVADNRALALAEVQVDKQTIETITLTTTTARIAHNWDTSAPGVSAGSHIITVRVVDASGNVNSASVRVTVRK